MKTQEEFNFNLETLMNRLSECVVILINREAQELSLTNCVILRTSDDLINWVVSGLNWAYPNEANEQFFERIIRLWTGTLPALLTAVDFGNWSVYNSTKDTVAAIPSIREYCVELSEELISRIGFNDDSGYEYFASLLRDALNLVEQVNPAILPKEPNFELEPAEFQKLRYTKSNS